ncbi:MAG: DUF1732 domain-containing protein [candidate division WOR-3 bacterium]|nr:DUF1732 domain-containing protein [candidate division WOR-3 bacterium]MDW7988161.1 DUF1732 domain-containing protein [candidate division WOR-3 bacterium]
MTGIGLAETQISYNKKAYRIYCEARSANHKYLELSLKLSPDLNFLEHELRNYLRKKLNRGTVSINIGIEEKITGEKVYNYEINYAAVKKILQETEKLTKKFQIPGELDIKTILSFPEVIVKTPDKISLKKAKLKKAVFYVLDLALKNLNQMRRDEGTQLLKEFNNRLQNILKILNNIKHYSNRIFTQNIKNNSVKPEDQTALRPITEELSRLRIHTNNFLKIINQNNQDGVGRKLDFILTEMLREADTILAKFRKGPVALWGIKIKEQIDILKEEIRNVE